MEIYIKKYITKPSSTTLTAKIIQNINLLKEDECLYIKYNAVDILKASVLSRLSAVKRSEKFKEDHKRKRMVFVHVNDKKDKVSIKTATGIEIYLVAIEDDE